MTSTTLADDRALRLTRGLRDLGYDEFIGVPCGILAPLFAALDTDPGRVLYAPREDTAVAVAAGAEMGGRRPLVVMQNSGLGQSVNALASLVVPYRLPIAMIVSLRGLPPDATGENVVMGRLTEPLLGQMGIATRRCGDIDDDLTWLARVSLTDRRPAALLVEPAFFGWDPAR
ncbi:sulfopyruvate decarboxylase subunit alpha [Microtetraspora sp. NBRC 13810]|uniref:thiamine pyrophosphate-binding protein n=1 Tax=Microtetraspora sp. NBRC 13810 TaxID=3030990 RepID=UPI0024A053DB|nr:thiamine pyrophosphate-binding protein [Microtetraspora sp. NBRC 13810]GLW10396.1 sulfopyruvate decarboxylase subunit alpha [Microtetraspora sp. NBRC 13810]